MNSNIINVDQLSLRGCYTSFDVNVVRVFDENYTFNENGTMSNDYFVKKVISTKYDIFYLTDNYVADRNNSNNVIIGFKIESKFSGKCFICVNKCVISTFRVSKNDDYYPHIILMRYNAIQLIFKKDSVR